MDIAKIQKLNQMAQNLKKHNIVCSKEEGIRRAERIYGEEHNFSDEFAKHYDDQDDMKKDVRKLTFALRDAIMEIKELKSQVNKLQKELNDVRVNPPRVVYRQTVAPDPHVQELPEKKEPEQQAKLPVQESSPKPPQPVIREEPKKVQDKPIDRNRIAPSDVAIEKFFYFGTK